MGIPERITAGSLRRLERPVWIFFAAMAILLVMNELVGRSTFDALDRNLRDRLHARETQTDLVSLLSSLKDAESGQRGYLLAGDPIYLSSYERGRDEAQKLLDRLKKRFDGDVQLAKMVDRMVRGADEKLNELASTLTAYSQRDPERAQRILDSGRGRQLMEELRSDILAIQRQEAARAAALDTEVAQQKLATGVLGVFTTGLMVAFLVFTFRLTERNLRERTRLLRASDQARFDAQTALEKESLALAEAKRLSRVKDEFLAVVSHELRTPLNAISGWASMLRESMDPREIREGVASIERNAQAQARIIEDLLDVSRIISGKLRLRVEPVDLKRLFREVCETLRPAIEAKSLHVDRQFCEESAEVLGDRGRLIQVLWNLLSNSIKFTPKGGRITLGLERAETILRVQVRDTGRGIAPEYLPRIFDRFSQADSSTTRQQGGLGLGLAIVKNLVEMHGGIISATSTGLGQGATFSIDLPLLGVLPVPEGVTGAPEAEETPLPTSESPLANLRGLRVLLLDDQRDTLDLMARLLRRCQAEVHPAGCVPEALAELQSWHPDVVVSDIGMPDEDGYSFIKKVRALPPQDGGNTPALALTAFARREDAQQALASGFQAHLTKPTDPVRLTRKIRELAEAH